MPPNSTLRTEKGAGCEGRPGPVPPCPSPWPRPVRQHATRLSTGDKGVSATTGTVSGGCILTSSLREGRSSNASISRRGEDDKGNLTFSLALYRTFRRPRSANRPAKRNHLGARFSTRRGGGKAFQRKKRVPAPTSAPVISNPAQDFNTKGPACSPGDRPATGLHVCDTITLPHVCTRGKPRGLRASVASDRQPTNTATRRWSGWGRARGPVVRR